MTEYDKLELLDQNSKTIKQIIFPSYFNNGKEFFGTYQEFVLLYVNNLSCTNIDVRYAPQHIINTSLWYLW